MPNNGFLNANTLQYLTYLGIETAQFSCIKYNSSTSDIIFVIQGLLFHQIKVHKLISNIFHVKL